MAMQECVGLLPILWNVVSLEAEESERTFQTAVIQ